MQAIRPVHHSVAGKRVLPHSMSQVNCSHEEYETACRIAITIFTDCTNVGVSFQDSLLAVYLSGLQHGGAIARGDTE